jgi:hypothetical protein
MARNMMIHKLDITAAHRERSARAMTTEAFLKLSTDTGVQHFCKMVLNGEIENPFSRASWERVIEYQGIANFPSMTKAQSVSKYLVTPIGTLLWQVAKASPMEPDERAQSFLVDERYPDMAKVRRADAHEDEDSLADFYKAARPNEEPSQGGKPRPQLVQDDEYTSDTSLLADQLNALGFAALF